MTAFRLTGQSTRRQSLEARGRFPTRQSTSQPRRPGRKVIRQSPSSGSQGMPRRSSRAAAMRRMVGDPAPAASKRKPPGGRPRPWARRTNSTRAVMCSGLRRVRGRCTAKSRRSSRLWAVARLSRSAGSPEYVKWISSGRSWGTRRHWPPKRRASSPCRMSWVPSRAAAVHSRAGPAELSRRRGRVPAGAPAACGESLTTLDRAPAEPRRRRGRLRLTRRPGPPPRRAGAAAGT